MRKRLLKIGFLIIAILLILFPLNTSHGMIKKPHSKKRQAITAKRSITKEDSIHIVRKGETLYRIARQNGLSIDGLKDLNSLKNNKLKIGQRLITKKEISSEERKAEEFGAEAGLAPPELEAPVPIKISEDPVFERQDEDIISQILSYSKELLGVPYRFGGATLRALDCSAFVQKIFKSIGIDLPRTAREQFKTGKAVDRDEISEGDLLFFKTHSRRYPSHVGIYIGNNQFIHASRKDRKVRIDSLDKPYYQKRLVGVKRLIEAEVTTETDKDKSI